MSVELSAEALTKMMRARYSVMACVWASITRTPLAFPFASSSRMEWTTESGRMVRLPVFCAQGSVDETELK